MSDIEFIDDDCVLIETRSTINNNNNNTSNISNECNKQLITEEQFKEAFLIHVSELKETKKKQVPTQLTCMQLKFGPQEINK